MPIENYIIESNPLTDPIGTVNRQIQANNQWNAEQAQKQMDFQREMSDTAHQREVADLKAAGLNPVLSARLGGASTPSGAMATADTSGVSSLVELLSMSIQTANTAALAAARSAGGGTGVSGSNSGSNIFGLDPSNYRIKNPTKPWQLAWNAGVDALAASGIIIDSDSLDSLAKSLGLSDEQKEEAKAESIPPDWNHNMIDPIALAFMNAWTAGTIPHNSENRKIYGAFQEAYTSGIVTDGVHKQTAGSFWRLLFGENATAGIVRKANNYTARARDILDAYGINWSSK